MDPLQTESVRLKVTKLLDSHLGIENIEALQSLSFVRGLESGFNRRTLKHDIEKRDLLATKSILKDFGKVKDELDKVCSSLNSMNQAMLNISQRLNETKKRTHHLIEQTTNLKSEENRVDLKLATVENFIKHFNITDNELMTLNSSGKDTVITLDFFSKFAHYENLYGQCKILIKCGFETSALDIMEKIGIQLEAATERLYRWTLGGCRNLDLPVNNLVPVALSKLQNRQVLFSNIVDEYCTSRKSHIVRRFIDVLTHGEAGSKPIEFFANEPKRYVGDILLWVYQIIPEEREYLTRLFGNCEKNEKENNIMTCLVCIMDAVCPPLKVRIDLILKPDKDPVVLRFVSNILYYYKDIFMQLLSKGQLTVTIQDLYKASEGIFYMSLDAKIQSELSHGVKAPPSDLSPSSIVTDLLASMREILSGSQGPNIPSKQTVKTIVSHILDPLLHAINETACHLSSTDMAVYLLNCIYHIQCTLSLYPDMEERNERLQAQSDAQLDTLTSEQASCLVANLNLGPIYTIMQEQTQTPLSTLPGMDMACLKNFFYKFDLFLSSTDQYLLPQLDLLLSQNHKKSIKTRAFQVITGVYNQLHSAIFDPSNQYTDPHLIIQKTPEEVAKIMLPSNL